MSRRERIHVGGSILIHAMDKLISVCRRVVHVDVHIACTFVLIVELFCTSKYGVSNMCVAKHSYHIYTITCAPLQQPYDWRLFELTTETQGVTFVGRGET